MTDPEYSTCEFKQEGSDLVYRPPNPPNEPIAQNSTIGVKFCQDIILLKSFLDQKEIEYDIEDLEKTPFGLGLRIKR